MRRALTLCGLALSLGALPTSGWATTARDLEMPRYAHIFVIVEENKDYGQIIGSADAPTITRFAHEYGNATDFYAETHPSEPNYVALVGGYTYGIRDDDAYFCRPHLRDPSCPGSDSTGYVNHTIDAPNLATQLEAAGFTWKNYLESLPAPGSLVASAGLYASKHSGFINFRSVQRDPNRDQHLVDFKQFYHDLSSGMVPSFSLVIPNVCNEMHGALGPGTPEGCEYNPIGKLIWRGDANIAAIAGRIMASPVWRSRENAAIVITFDENDDQTFVGCCGNDPHDAANRGGGHIPTIVMTNHGPRHIDDPTPYNHYSLLRTIEDAFGIYTHLKKAAAPGVVPMLPLFRQEARTRSAGA